MNTTFPPESTRRGVSRWLVAFLTGGACLLLLVCLIPCFSLGLLRAGKKAREHEVAKDADTPPPVRAAADPRPHPVGLRHFTFTYRPDEGAARQRKVVLWYPTTGEVQPHDYTGLKGFATPEGPLAPGRHPVVLFSHGYRGAAVQTIFLTESLAREGYIVAAVDHADSLLERQEKPFDLGIFFKPEKWDDNSYRDRRDDLVALIDHLLAMDGDKDSYLHEHVDKEAIGAAGHSLGGYTVGGTSGGWPKWRERRIRAALLLSPYTLPYTKNLSSVDMPVMLQGGTTDWGITPFLLDTYKALPGPKYFLVLKNASHFEWSNVIQKKGQTTTELAQEGNGKLITNYSIAFFNHHLRGEDAPLLEKKAEGLEAYQFQSAAKR
jgi:predicted dienelactone hydrolase